MLPKELKKEVLRKPAHFKENNMLSVYKTRHLHVIEGHADSKVIFRIGIAKDSFGIYDYENQKWYGVNFETYLTNHAKHSFKRCGFTLDEAAEKYLKKANIYYVDAKISEARSYKKNQKEKRREKEIRKIIRMTERKVPAGFEKFSRSLFDNLPVMLFDREKGIIRCPYCQTASSLPPDLKQHKIFTCPACGKEGKARKEKADDTFFKFWGSQWSQLIQVVDGKTVIRYFYNDLVQQGDQLKFCSVEKIRDVFSESGAASYMRSTSADPWKDYRLVSSYMGQYDRSLYPIYGTYLYKIPCTVEKTDLFKHSCLKNYCKETIQNRTEAIPACLVWNYLYTFLRYPVVESMAKLGMYHLIDSVGDYITKDSFSLDTTSIRDALKLHGVYWKYMLEIQNPTIRELQVLQFLEIEKRFLKKEERDTLFGTGLGEYGMKELVRFTQDNHITVRKCSSYVTQHANGHYSDYYDYIRWTKELGMKKSDSIFYPKNFYSAHDRVYEEYKAAKDEIERANQRKYSKMIAEQWEEKRKMPVFHFENGKYTIFIPHGISDLKKEGNTLHHCVGSYGKLVASMQTQIYFIREKSNPRKSFYTLEINHNRMVQCRTVNNQEAKGEVNAFAEAFLNNLKKAGLAA